MIQPLHIVLVALRMVVFGLALALTTISFQAYRQRSSRRLQYAFIGFSFISMGVALSMLGAVVDQSPLLFSIAETVPFIVGFSTLCASLYQ